MPSLNLALAVSACVSLVSAYPSVLPFAKRQVEIDTPFDPEKQLVSITGEHAFMPPGEGDVRSPCPALNVLANHNYIPRNGYATLAQVEQALITVYGASPDFAAVLNVILLGSTGTKGDQYNIGGYPSWQTGYGAYQYKGLSLIGTIEGPQPVATICERFDKINGSQYIVADPISNQGQGIDFLYFRTMGNHTAEFPDGTMGPSSMLPFLAETPNGNGNFTWAEYMNRIPENWYKRNEEDPYTTAFFASDIAAIYEYYGFQDIEHPYSSINMFLLTHGTYTNEDLEDGATNMCFLIQAFPIVVPALAKLPAVSEAMRQNIATGVSDFTKGVASVSCSKTMTSMDMALLSNVLGIPGLL